MSLTPYELQILYNQSTEISRIASYEQMHPTIQMQMYQEFFRRLSEEKQKTVDSSPSSSEDSVKSEDKDGERSADKNRKSETMDRNREKGRFLDLQL